MKTLNVSTLVSAAVHFPNLRILLRQAIRGCATFLDVGCGTGSPIARLTARGYLVGIDLFRPHLRLSRRSGRYAESILGDVRALPVRSRAVDCVSALDVLEHLRKRDGYVLIRQMEHLARKRIIILTPNGFDPDDHLEGTNPLHVHRSGWDADELRARGYRVHGAHGLKHLRRVGAYIKPRPVWLWDKISGFTQKLTYFAPHHAFHLLCVKSMERPSTGVSPTPVDELI